MLETEQLKLKESLSSKENPIPSNCFVIIEPLEISPNKLVCPELSVIMERISIDEKFVKAYNRRVQKDKASDLNSNM